MVTALKNTRERLIEKATDLIWKSSYGSVSVDDICKASDAKKGSFYHYFPSKIDLTVASMQHTYEIFRPIMDELFAPEIPPIARFEKYIEATYTIQKEIAEEHGMVCGCPFISLGVEMAPQDEKIRQKTDEIIGLHQEYYKTALRDMIAEGSLPQGTNVESKADQIHTFVIGQMMMARIRNSSLPLKRDMRSGLFLLIGIQDIEIDGVKND